MVELMLAAYVDGKVQAGVAEVRCSSHFQGNFGAIGNPCTMSPCAGHALILGSSDLIDDVVILLGLIHLTLMVLQ